MAALHTSPLQSLLVDSSFDGEVYPHEPMARHTTYHIGGPARFYVRVNSIGALTSLVDRCESSGVNWTVVGRGSNLLVSDEGYDGVIICLGRDFRSIQVDDERPCFVAGAGAHLSLVVQTAFQGSFAGFEFAVGTPGTVGGALRMNAGTRDEWIGSRVITLTSFIPGTGLIRRRGSEIAWDYRSSSLGEDEIVLECELSVTPADPFYIRGKMEANLARRKREQPLSAYSCGSVFRNPPGTSAGQLIEDCGFKGMRMGDAQVSPQHANFIVNLGNASASDVRALMTTIQTKVNETYGIQLQPEVRFLGFA